MHEGYLIGRRKVPAKPIGVLDQTSAPDHSRARACRPCRTRDGDGLVPPTRLWDALWRHPCQAQDMRRWWSLVWLVLVVLLLGGCVSKPVVELHSARLAMATPQGIGMDVFLRVNNENSFDVQVRNVNVNVVIAGRFQLPPVQFSPNQWLAADKSTLVRVPMVVPWPMVAPLLAATVGSKTITYRARGTADVTAVRMLGIQRNDYPVNEKGELSRAALVAAAGRGGMF